MIVFLVDILVAEIDILEQDLRAEGKGTKFISSEYGINNLKQDILEHLYWKQSEKVERFFYENSNTIMYFRNLDNQLTKKIKEK